MTPKSKWHIYNFEGEPLCWDGMAIEFDDYIVAEDFLRAVQIITGENFEPHSFKEDTLPCDISRVNLTNFIPTWSGDGDEIILIERTLKR